MNLKSTKSQRIQFSNNKFINQILGVGGGGGGGYAWTGLTVSIIVWLWSY